MALFSNFRRRRAARRRQRIREEREGRKAQATDAEEGKLVAIERSAEHFQRYNFSQTVPDVDIWEYFKFSFPRHGAKMLGWRTNGYSFHFMEHEEMLRLAGLLDRAREGEKVIGYFDAEGELVALEKVAPPMPPTTLLQM